MMEEVLSEDTNGDSTFEFVGDAPQGFASLPTSLTTSILTPAEVVETSEAPELVNLPPSAPPLQAASIVPMTLPSNTQTIASVSGDPICYAPRPSYDPLSASTVPSATIDLSSVQEDNVTRFPRNPSLDSPTGGVWSWIKQSDLLNKFAEKAKNSVDSMITTLDPGMKDYIYSGGDINVLVASDVEWILSAIREAFQQTFGRATVEGCSGPVPTGAPQPVGFSAGVKMAEERCQLLRSNGAAEPDQVLVAVQNILVETTPEKWFYITCLVLQNPSKQSFLQAFTQPTVVPYEYVNRAQDATSPDYPLRWSGLAVTIDQAAGTDQWCESVTGVTRKEMLLLAARSLAGTYKSNH